MAKPNERGDEEMSDPVVEPEPTNDALQDRLLRMEKGKNRREGSFEPSDRPQKKKKEGVGHGGVSGGDGVVDASAELWEAARSKLKKMGPSVGTEDYVGWLKLVLELPLDALWVRQEKLEKYIKRLKVCLPTLYLDAAYDSRGVIGSSTMVG